MARLLIVYGTTEGQTRKIAQHIADVAARRGCEVDVVDGRNLLADFSLDGYAGVVVGASVHGRRYQSYIHDFALTHRAALARMPAAFFSVSWAAAWPRAGLDRLLLARFFEEVGWRPRHVASFAGAFAFNRYGRYGPLPRLVMRLMMLVMAMRLGAPSRMEPSCGPSRDYEFTDWRAVTRFAAECAEALSARPAPAASG